MGTSAGEDIRNSNRRKSVDWKESYSFFPFHMEVPWISTERAEETQWPSERSKPPGIRSPVLFDLLGTMDCELAEADKQGQDSNLKKKNQRYRTNASLNIRKIRPLYIPLKCNLRIRLIRSPHSGDGVFQARVVELHFMRKEESTQTAKVGYCPVINQK